MYTKIDASIDFTRMLMLLRRITFALFLISIILFIVQSQYPQIGFIPVIMVGLMNVACFASILQYGKREILHLTTPPKTRRTIMGTLNTLGRHILDLILVPMLTIVILLNAYATITLSIPNALSLGTIGFTLLSLTQIAPLRFQKNKYARAAHLRISDSVTTITVSRNMIEGLDRRTRKYKEFLGKIMQSEEIIRSDSDFLMLSGGKIVTMISVFRMMMPLVGILPTLLGS